MRDSNKRQTGLLVIAACLFATPAAAQAPSCPDDVSNAQGGVDMEWITVGDPGNDADLQVNCGNAEPGCGSVEQEFCISKFEITYSLYAKLLNAVAAEDPHGLYTIKMTDQNRFGGIKRSGADVFVYTVVTEDVNRENVPAAFIDFYDAIRFVNWVANGAISPTDPTGITEDGAYKLTEELIAANAVVREADAEYFLPNRNEWYKAAYYNGDSETYFDYPAGSDTPTTCSVPGPDPNTANCNNAVRGAGYSPFSTQTDVGAYFGSPSPYGTFDQGGNLFEWTEGIRYGLYRVLAGGGLVSFPSDLAATGEAVFLPTAEYGDMGFRIAKAAIAGGMPSTPPLDTDADSVLDSNDNCTLAANASQTDADGDGFGNQCDADFDGDGTVGGPDFLILFSTYSSSFGDPNYVPSVDCNDDGVIGGPDVVCFLNGFMGGQGPGPAGAL